MKECKRPRAISASLISSIRVIEPSRAPSRMSLRGIFSEMSFSSVDDGRSIGGGGEARSSPEYSGSGIVTDGNDEKKGVVRLVAIFGGS